MLKIAEFKAHEILTFLSSYGFETTFHDFLVYSTKRFFVKNVAYNVEFEFVLYDNNITLTITEQKADFGDTVITKNQFVKIKVKTLDFLLKYLKEENDYFKTFDNFVGELPLP